MTAILFFIGVILVAATVWLVASAVALPRARIAIHLRQIEQYGFNTDAHDDSAVGVDERQASVLAKPLGAIGRIIRSAVPWLRPLERRELSAAGMYTTSPDVVHGLRATAAVFALFLVVLSGPGVDFLSLLLLAGAPWGGWSLPAFMIRQRGTQRLNAIDRDLPRLIDVLIATIEAGMGFAASLQMISGRFKGPMGLELRLMQREQGLGVSTEQALNNMMERCDTPSVRAFARSLVHGQELGVSIGPMLRNIAVDIRRRRRQTAREKVQKAPLKMLFPLILLIFPPLMIIILYPALYSIVHTLSGG
jgi:tight adherence protein C